MLPGKKARCRDDNILTLERHNPGKRLWTGLHVAMQPDRVLLQEDADIYGVGMQVNAAVKLVLFGAESHEVSSSVL